MWVVHVGSTPARKRDLPASKLAVVQLRAKHALQNACFTPLATVSQIAPQSLLCQFLPLDYLILWLAHIENRGRDAFYNYQ
jgi:hypothetical protein